MTREEELKRAAYACSNRYEDMQKFLEGAEWADKHKQNNLENNYLSFSLSECEYKDYMNFRKKHKECHKPITISFTPTGIGNGVYCKCEGCGETIDITDVNSW